MTITGGSNSIGRRVATWNAHGLTFIIESTGLDEQPLLDATRAIRPATKHEWASVLGDVAHAGPIAPT